MYWFNKNYYRQQIVGKKFAIKVKYYCPKTICYFAGIKI